jgi:hypothetical protein
MWYIYLPQDFKLLNQKIFNMSEFFETIRTTGLSIQQSTFLFPITESSVFISPIVDFTSVEHVSQLSGNNICRINLGHFNPNHNIISCKFHFNIIFSLPFGACKLFIEHNLNLDIAYEEDFNTIFLPCHMSSIVACATNVLE